MFTEETRLHELGGKAADGAISDAEFTELVTLSRARQKSREDRAAMVCGLRENLQRQGITIHELFTSAEIAAAQLASATGRSTVGAKKARAQSPAAAWVRQKTGVVLVEVNVEGSNGFPCRYCAGQDLPYYVPKGLKLLDDGKLETNLPLYFTETGKQYFATAKGQTELARLTKYIRTHKIKPKLR